MDVTFVTSIRKRGLVDMPATLTYNFPDVCFLIPYIGRFKANSSITFFAGNDTKVIASKHTQRFSWVI